MDFISLGEMYDLYKYLTRKALFDSYESAFSETRKKFPLADKKEAQLSQISKSRCPGLMKTIGFRKWRSKNYDTV